MNGARISGTGKFPEDGSSNPGGADRRPNLLRLIGKFKLEIAILILLALTYAAIRYADVLLHKELVISRESGAPFAMDRYDDRQEGTGHSEMVIDPKDRMSASCMLREGFFPNPFCGFEIVLADASGTKGMDLGKYRSLTVDLSYRGPSKSFRIFIKNYDERYSKPHARHTSKFHTTEVFFPGGRLRKEIPLTQFPVAEWWVVREQQDPQATQPTMNNVVSIDIDTATRPELGRHDFTIHSVTLTGTIIPLDQWYLIIIAFWVVLIALFLAHRIIGYRRRAERERRVQEQETQRLEAAKAAAEKASTAKSAFLSNMSHELRTPLNAILGYAQLLERVQVEDRHASAARTIRDSGSHLLMLINDILDLSKIEAGKVEIRPSRCDLHACLRGVADMIRIRAADKDLEFELSIAADIPHHVIADETRLRQVLINLLGNAVKFTRVGCVELKVSRLASSGQTVRLRFEVEDSGIGIGPEERDAIFRPFEQAGDIDGKAAGTGLGLSISKQFIGLMGGEIRVESQPGRGSRFWFDLSFPLAQPTAVPWPPSDISGYVGARRTILVVDDLDANRLLLAQELDELGFDTLEAEGGAKAVELAERHKPDLIFMDLKMPGMDGFEATKLLRANAKTGDIPIVAASASATAEIEEASKEAGANAFVAKPIERPQLTSLLADLLAVTWVGKGEERFEASEVAGGCLTPPPPERMEVLLHHARAGNMTAIKREADMLTELDERYRPFAEKLRKLAGNYQSQGLLRLIEGHCAPRAAA